MLIFLQTFLAKPRVVNGGWCFHFCTGACATYKARTDTETVAQEASHA